MWDPEKTVRYNVPPPPGRARPGPFPGSHPPPHKPHRKPSFAPTSTITLSDSNDSSVLGLQRKRHNCLMCCAWLFLISFALAIVVLIAGVAFVTILRSALPQVRVVAFDVPWLRVDNQSDTLLTAVFRAQIELYNKNSDTQLHYSDLMVDAASGNIRLGEAPLPGFVQDSKNRTVLNVQTTLSRGVVNEDDAIELGDDANNAQLVVTAVLSGHVGFHLGVLQMNRVPLLVVCRDVKQRDIVFGRRPNDCEVQIFKYR